MVIVIDFDGTLALGDTSSIISMTPNLGLIKIINQMYLDGNYIKIVTARGSKSCKNIDERYSKYLDQLQNWLKHNEVYYNEISFNKEYGDIYIDDRCYNIKGTILYSKLDSRFTENKVRRINDHVIKKSSTSKTEFLWYSHASNIGINIPRILSYDTDTLATEYLDGVKSTKIEKITEILRVFKNSESLNKSEFATYKNRIENHLVKNSNIKNADKIIRLLGEINPPRTFNHGDFSVDNIIESNGKIFLIDPIYDYSLFQSFWIDSAKHLFTILYYSLDINFYEACRKKYIEELGVEEKALDILIASESIRVSNRKKNLIDISNNLIDSI
jgi:tRNA A-37 threonylcarbamoyl transferase component Bud32